MLGAIVGDIVGSVYEWYPIKRKEFTLFSGNNFFTDDTVMTAAIADAIMKGGKKNDFIEAIKEFGWNYRGKGYGTEFSTWLFSDSREPYNSFGNGSAMRVSPCAWAMDCESFVNTGCWPEDDYKKAELSAAVTHNHPEGIKGALAVTDAIFLCRYFFGGFCEDLQPSDNDNKAEIKRRIKEHIENKFGYNLSRSLDEIRPNYEFNETCQGSVPEAIISFLESTDFEDAIRNAISLGGDSDTLGAIAGSIAEAAYGIPDWIKKEAYMYLDERIIDVINRWNSFLSRRFQ